MFKRFPVALALAASMALFSSVGVSASPSYNDMPPMEQLEQRCDVEAMERLDADKVIAYTFAQPEYTSTSVSAPGAVFRKNSKWYRLSYQCETKDDLRTILSFNMKVGEIIPREDWQRYYLYP